MHEELERLITEGDRALAGGEWAAAKEAFRAALELEDRAEAAVGLGETLWWLGDMAGSLASYERAYAAARRQGDATWAAAAALRLGFHNRSHLANDAAAAGWLGRARRLIEDHGLDALRGELLLLHAHAAGDPAEAERIAREALAFGRRSGDADLELCALSWLGVTLTRQARLEEGMALLDESMAASLGGEAGRLDTVVFASCNMMTSCARCAAFERAVQWVRAAERFVDRHGCPFLYVDCRTVYGSVLLACGRWPAAEQELQAAIRLAGDAVPAYRDDAVAALAELRLGQGRLEEAQRLLAGLAGDAAAAVRAMLHLRCGQPALAVAELRRRLQRIGSDQLESARLQELLGEAEIALGDGDAAAARGLALTELGRSRDCAVIVARGERLRGHALLMTQPALAAEHLGLALEEFLRLGMPYEVARTRLLLARSARYAVPEVAAVEAEAAFAMFDELGAATDADAAAALLRALGVKAARIGPRRIGTLTAREREVLTLLGEGLSNPEIAQRLFISRKTVEHHVGRVLAKLGLRSRAEAAATAVRQLAAGEGAA